LELIKDNYGTTIDSFQAIQWNQLNSIMTNSEKSWVSILKKNPIYNYDSENGWLETSTKLFPSACVVSHPYQLILPPEKSKQNIYYMDFLAVSKTVKTQMIYSLIYSHLWNQHRDTPNIQITLFKKEGTGIVGCRPFLTFNTFIYNLNSILNFPNKDNNKIKNTIVNDVNYVRHVCENPYLQSDFSLLIMGNISYIYSQILNKRFFIGILWDENKEDPLVYFFFSRDWVELSMGEYCLQFNGTKIFRTISDELLFCGWNQIIREIIRENKGFSFLKIDDISENYRIQQMIYYHGGKPLKQQLNYFYFYNYIYPNHLSSKNCFIFI
jgi:hypothetical protein